MLVGQAAHSGPVGGQLLASRGGQFFASAEGSNFLSGNLDEFDRELDLYRKLLRACGVSAASQVKNFSGTRWRVLNPKP